MKNAMTEKQSDLIKMENGKKDLPVGISKTKWGSYRLQRTVNQKKYRFGSIQSLDLALTVNQGIDELVKDLRAALDRPEGVTEEQLIAIADANMDEIDRKFDMLFGAIESQNRLIIRKDDLLHERILDLSNERKGFFARLFGS